MIARKKNIHKRILVTGSAGFIGSAFCSYWKEKYPLSFVVGIDSLTYAANEAIMNQYVKKYNNSFVFVHGDINNRSLIKQLIIKYQLDTIVHFAAESHVDNSIANPDIFIYTNVVGTHTLASIAKEMWVDNNIPHHFHHVSTDEVYGSLGPDELSFTETSPYRPNSPYSASKAASDHIIRSYYQTYGLQSTISNCSNNFGPNQHKEKLIPMCINSILTNQPITIYGDGLQIRDWLFVIDHCRGIDSILENGTIGDVYNIGCRN